MNITLKQVSQQKKPFLKFSGNLSHVLGSKSSALLFEALQYRFNKYPDGFYKFIAPCKSQYYRKGDSLSEELGVTRFTIRNVSKCIVASYKSKALYAKAIEEHGEEGAFMDKPFLSYRDNATEQTFYLRNESTINLILEGKYNKIQHVTCKANSTRHMLNFYTCTCVKIQHVGILEPIENIEEKPLIHTHKEELANNTILSKAVLITSARELSTDTKQPEQPKVEELKNDWNTEQPEQPLPFQNPSGEDDLNTNSRLSKEVLGQVPLSTLNTMIDHWKAILKLDMAKTPTATTTDNLCLAYVNIFESSMDNWVAYCKLFTSSKFLMGETSDNFKLNLAFAAKSDTISKIINGHFTLGDRHNVIYLTLKAIEDEDPFLLKFKHTCLEKMGEPRYKSWIEPLVIRKDSSGRIICRAPNKWFAEFISLNDMLGFGSFIKSIGVPAVVIEYEGMGGHQGVGTKIAGTIYPYCPC